MQKDNLDPDIAPDIAGPKKEPYTEDEMARGVPILSDIVFKYIFGTEAFGKAGEGDREVALFYRAWRQGTLFAVHNILEHKVGREKLNLFLVQFDCIGILVDQLF